MVGGPPWEEWEYVLLSSLEHYSYCQRQCALIHVEQSFAENLLTTRGRLTHARVDSGAKTALGDRTEYRAIPLWSDELGLLGKADLVELRPGGAYPVEFKVGRPGHSHAFLQLCGQALCLEEMLGEAVPQGAVFYHGTRRRESVVFDDDLREQTRAAIRGVRLMLDESRLPPASNDARCPNCSLRDICLPQLADDLRRMESLQSMIFRPLALGEDDA